MNGKSEPGRIVERAELEALLTPRVQELRAWVQRRCGRALLSREPVSDLVQSALGDMLEHAGEVRFTDEPAFRRWVQQVALHKLVSKSRFHAAQKRDGERLAHLASAVFDLPERDRSSIAHSPSEHAGRAEDLDRLAVALEKLSDEDREIVCLRRFLDVPTPEIATILSMPESTVRWRLARAMATLATQLR